jgi:uncharacterized protein involved in outer membrane biogenesis
MRRLRNGAVTIAVLVAVYALLGFLVLPLLAKPRIEAALTEELGRQATIGRIDFNPFTLRGRVTDFALADREPGRFLARFAALDLDVSAASLRYRAPVFDAVRLSQPRIELTRNADNTYSIDDLIAKAQAQPEGPSPQFSLNNIEVEGGEVVLNDRAYQRRLAASALDIGIPFLSSLPHDAEIRVTPKFEGTFDGTPFALQANSTSPFENAKEATLEWSVDALPFAKYAAYMALPGGIKLVDGALTTRMRLTFVTENNVARTLTFAGTARVDKPAFARRDGSALVAAKAVDVTLAKLDLLARSVALARVAIDAPEADLRREADGTLELARLLASPAAAPAGARAGSPATGGTSRASTSSPWKFSVEEAQVADGRVRVADRSVSPAFEAALSNVAVTGRRIVSSGTPGEVTLAFDVDGGARFEMKGEVDVARPSARGRFAFTAFHLAKLYPYYAPLLNLEVRSGTLDLAGEFTADGTKPQLTLSGGTAKLADLETALRGDKTPLWRVANGTMDGVTFDLHGRSMAIDHVALQRGSLRVLREANGTVKFQRLVRGAEAAAKPDGGKPPESGSQDFKFTIGKLEVERLAADFEDRSVAPPVKLRMPDVRASVANFSAADAAKFELDATVRIGSRGSVAVKGALVLNPLAADWRVDARRVDLVPLRPYFEPQTNIVVTGGSVDARGRIVYATPRSSAPRISYKGDATITDFGSLDRPTSQELVRWKTVSLTGIEAANEPFAVALGSIAMNGFFARVILNADATLNLKELLKPETAAQASAAAPPTVAGATTKDLRQSAAAAGTTTKELRPPSTADGLPVSIGRIEIADGEVQYSDFFVQPNYNVHLTDVSGTVSALSKTQAGEVQLAGRVEGTAPVDVRGTVNPFAEQISLDLTGKANDVDLPPLTPYSVKYAGYGITKGKLSLEVHYRIENRKLAATNKLKLDQLTFGEHVDSPTATKLPVLLAVSLLKDRNGVINLDLPIQGTLDDPKFSVWGVIVQIVVNLVTKAITAPFALLGAIAGAPAGEQLAYVEFAPGRADLLAEAQTKLRTLAKALADRPGLKMDVIGRAAPDADREGLKHAMLDRAIRVQKQKTLAEEGESTSSVDAIKIDEKEYPKLLEAVYKATDLPDKPRNFIGIAKSIPPAEMESLLLASYRADDPALAALANRRATTVKEWLAGEGGIASDRVFVVAPKLTADGITDKGAPTRVDFAIR